MSDVSRNAEELSGVTLLGNQNTKYSDDYSPEVLETFVNKHPDNDYVVTFDAYEFTSKCVVGDTPVNKFNVDEPLVTTVVPIKDLVGTTGQVLGFATDRAEFIAADYFDVRKTGEQVPVVKVEYKIPNSDETSCIRCTPDHMILVRVGLDKFEWVQAEHLTPGDRVVTCETSSWLETDKKYPEIISVEPDGVDDVYNMEVAGIHNFCGNGIVIHNCPKTGQPDFAKVTISYIPDKKMVESKSLKLYLFSFRNHGDFHEDCMNIIMKDLVKLMDPKYLEVYGDFTSRGGICITPFVTYAREEKYEKFAEARQLAMLGHAVKHVPWPRG